MVICKCKFMCGNKFTFIILLQVSIALLKINTIKSKLGISYTVLDFSLQLAEGEYNCKLSAIKNYFSFSFLKIVAHDITADTKMLWHTLALTAK